MKQFSKIFVCIVIIAFVFSSCSKKMMFNSSPVVPAARGDVKVKKDKNNNYEMEISVNNLAPSKQLTPPRKTYVVWIETERNGVQNIGQVNSSSGLFSDALKASLKAVTPYRPTAVFITAEDNAGIQYPGSITVLRTDNFSVK